VSGAAGRSAQETGGDENRPFSLGPATSNPAASDGDPHPGGNDVPAPAAGGSPANANQAEPSATLAFRAVLTPVSTADPQASGAQASGGNGRHNAAGASADVSANRAGYRLSHDPSPAGPVAAPGGESGTAFPAGLIAQSRPSAAPPVPAGATNPGPAVSPGKAASLSAVAAEAAPAPKPPSGATAREVQLELRDANARVNVRLVERAGSVEVDVRTPDSHLASALRDDLPALTSRLEQTGMRAEFWRDAPAAGAARAPMAEQTAGAGFSSSQNQSRREGGGGRDPREGQSQEKRQNQSPPESKEFSWLYTSLT